MADKMGASKFTAGPGEIGGGGGPMPGSPDFVSNWVMSGGAMGAAGSPAGAPDDGPPEGVVIEHYRDYVSSRLAHVWLALFLTSVHVWRNVCESFDSLPLPPLHSSSLEGAFSESVGWLMIGRVKLTRTCWRRRKLRRPRR